MHLYSRAYDGLWSVQSGGRAPVGCFAGANGAAMWLDGKRMALAEALVVRDLSRNPPLRLGADGNHVPDWFEDHEAAEQRWHRIHKRG